MRKIRKSKEKGEEEKRLKKLEKKLQHTVCSSEYAAMPLAP